MDETEAGQLLSAAGLNLPDDRVAELTEQTEGWPAGLYLAALSIRARGHGAKGVTTFSGSDRLVSDYLRSELLAHLSADLRRFLTRTSVLERMSGPLCDAVLEERGSAAILESLARSNLFLVPLDANGEWYRYHHLFQELLRLELARAEPDLAPSLLARASAWCEANGQPETAVGYAQEAGDTDRVARLVERYGLRYLPNAAASRPPSAGSIGWKRRGQSTGTRRSPYSARFSPRCGAGLHRPSAGPRRPKTPRTTAPCPTAARRSTPGWHSCVPSVVTEGWQR